MRLSQLRRLPCAAAIGFVSYTNKPPAEQRSVLRRAIVEHEVIVRQNAKSRSTICATYDAERCSYFPHYHLVTLPVTSGVHRQAVRDGLTGSHENHGWEVKDGESEACAGATETASQLSFRDPLRCIRELVLQPWQAAGARRAIVFGGTSTAYVHRLLEAETAHSYLIVDHSLKCLANMAATLVPRHGQRVWFLRCEAIFTCLAILPPCCADLALVPMPMPVWSAKSSHRRLVTCDFWCAAHRILRVRAGVDDARGMLLFTDCERYAEFMMEQLAAAKLIVPWARKNPLQTFAPWLPLSLCAPKGGDGTAYNAETREFAKQRNDDVVAIAASKSGPTTPQAERLLAMYNYKRKYYRALDGKSDDEDDNDAMAHLTLPSTLSVA